MLPSGDRETKRQQLLVHASGCDKLHAAAEWMSQIQRMHWCAGKRPACAMDTVTHVMTARDVGPGRRFGLQHLNYTAPPTAPLFLVNNDKLMHPASSATPLIYSIQALLPMKQRPLLLTCVSVSSDIHRSRELGSCCSLPCRNTASTTREGKGLVLVGLLGRTARWGFRECVPMRWCAPQS